MNTDSVFVLCSTNRTCVEQGLFKEVRALGRSTDILSISKSAPSPVGILQNAAPHKLGDKPSPSREA